MSNSDLQQLEELFSAAFNGNKDEVGRLLSEGIDPSIPRSDGLTALHGAVQEHHEDVVRLLIDWGVDVNTACSTNDTPGMIGWSVLHSACVGGNEKIVELLLQHGAKPNVSTENGSTPLLVAVSKKNDKIARILVNHGADPFFTSEAGITAIAFAMQAKNESMLQALIDEIDFCFGNRVQSGYDLLKQASEMGMTAIATLLLALGVDPSHNPDGGTPELALLSAIAHNHQDIVEPLLSDSRIDVDAALPMGATALMMGAELGNSLIVRQLLDAGANVSTIDDNKKTALHHALKSGHEDVGII